MLLTTCLVLLGLVVLFLFLGRPRLAWIIPSLVALTVLGWRLGVTREDVTVGKWFFGLLACVFLGALVVFGVRSVRRTLISRRVMKVLAGALPQMSETERVALEAGSVWWDGELFSGNPNWRKILDFQVKPLSPEEQAFLDGPVTELCAMLDDWQVQEQHDLPESAWSFIKEHRFFGMIIPKEYGGLGFSGAAHAAVVTKLSSRSVAAAVSVMVPNSLGPAELLLHYGTNEQKDYYLGRLARGEIIPCFALTEPAAGSDASSISSSGVVCRGEFDGEEVFGIRLNWDKRYITLAPVATVLGLAFQLSDPDGLLGGEVDLGITCALISPDLPGVEIGQRHDPLRIPFLNGPTRGHDVFVPLDAIIGGRAMAGKGWLMLMQCLAAGRGISLPSLSVGAAQLSTRLVGTYGNIREQFGVAIGAFEGVEERIARIGAFTYLMDAARRVTAASVDAGEKPAVVSAIVKHYLTELMRVVVNDAMDVQAGAAICRGPRNVLASAYQSVPVGITVEGANILTRSLIIYGQGAIRCHPFVHAQMEAIARKDLATFDRAFFGHVGFVATNVVRSLVLGLTGGRPCRVADAGLGTAYLARLGQFSAAFVTLSDAAMGILGGALKRKEKISGRFADALGWMYLCTATIKRFHDAGQPRAEAPMMRWACEHALFEIQQALLGVLENFPVRPVAWALRRVCFPLGARCKRPSDALGARVARGVLQDAELLDRLTGDIYVPPADEVGLGMLNATAPRARAARETRKKLTDAVKAGSLEKRPRSTLAQRGCDAGVITAEELQQLEAALAACLDAIQVDAFGDRRTPAGAAHAPSVA
ncbi:MAG: acyl-CoA dehydrogenase [Planctomycetota bacterium]